MTDYSHFEICLNNRNINLSEASEDELRQFAVQSILAMEHINTMVEKFNDLTTNWESGVLVDTKKRKPARMWK